MRWALQLGFSAFVLMAVACGGSTKQAGTSSNGGTSNSNGGASSICPAGSERCACYGNSTCDQGLDCRSDLCVSGGNGGSTSTGGTRSTGGTLGNGGGMTTIGGQGGGFNASQGGTGAINGTGLPAAQDTTDGLYGISATDAANLKTAACAGWQAEPEGSGSAIMEFVMDITSSMRIDSSDPNNPNAATKWTVFSQTMPGVFAALPASFAVGALYFAAQTNQCYAANNNDVPIATNTAAQSQRLQTSVSTVQPNGTTPTYQAWHQALQTVTAWQPGPNDPPGLVTAAKYIVLITDGVPTVGRTNDCTYLQNGITQAEYDTELQLIRTETTASGVKTFVVGIVGSNNPQNALFEPLFSLSKIAVIGGTANPPGCVPTSGTVLPNDVNPRGTYCHYDLSAATNLASALSGAITGIASGIMSCDYTIPAPPAGKTIDPKTTTLVFTDGASGNTSIVLPNTSANCDRGWQFTDSTNAHITICGVTCNALQQNTMSTLSLIFGCAAGQIING